MKNYTISRKFWLNWNSMDLDVGNKSALYRQSDGLMCCLGQICNQSGVAKKNLDDVGVPDGIQENAARRSRIPKVLFDDNKINDIISLNDQVLYFPETQKQREQKLVEAFANIDITVEFIS